AEADGGSTRARAVASRGGGTAMNVKRVETKRGARVRVLEAGSGASLVFLHGAGGFLHENPFLDELATRYRVYAPELPGYGESTGEELLEDMLDFALHGWDVVAALGLERPHLVGHSMGGMIEAEMAAIAPNDLAKLVLVSAAGLWLPEHPIPDLFAFLPHEYAQVLFHDPEAGHALLTGGLDLTNMQALTDFYIANTRRMATAGTDLFGLSGGVALVTGGRRGRGREMAPARTRSGAGVMLASSKQDACDAAAGESRRTTGRRTLGRACHVGRWNELEGLVDAAYEHFGAVDILVNNAGMSPLYPSVDAVTEELWDKVLAVNLKGPFRLTALIGSRMAQGTGG